MVKIKNLWNTHFEVENQCENQHDFSKMTWLAYLQFHVTTFSENAPSALFNTKTSPQQMTFMKKTYFINLEPKGPLFLNGVEGVLLLGGWAHFADLSNNFPGGFFDGQGSSQIRRRRTCRITRPCLRKEQHWIFVPFGLLSKKWDVFVFCREMWVDSVQVTLS